MSWIRVVTHALGLLAVSVAGFRPTGTLAASGPSLVLTAAPGYVFAVEGHGWAHRRTVAATVYAVGWTVGIQIQPGLHGYFKMGVRRMDICGDTTITATDTAGRSVSVRRMGPLCASPSNPPRPVLVALRGRIVRTTIHRLIEPGGQASVTMKLGDRLSLWDAGTTAPMFIPHADSSFLALLEQYRGTQPPPSTCSASAAGCAAGFVWTWVAVRTGKTLIDLSPTCLQTRPPCAMPDFAVTVRIVP